MGADDDDDDDDEPKRKRVRRGVAANGKVVESAPIVRRRSTRTRTVTREPSPEGREEDDDMDVDVGGKRRRKLGSGILAESRQGSLSRSSSRAAIHLDRYGRGYSSASPALHSATNLGGFDLPPLNAALGGSEMSHMVLTGRGLVFPTSAGYVGGTSGREFGSSYIRSGSAAPSRAHSPNFVLPPLHQQLYGANGSLHHSRQPSPNAVPSIPELERHYYELAEEKRRLEEMLDKTDKLMAGVRRGMDELRERDLAMAQQQLQQAQQQQQRASQSPTIPQQGASSASRAPSPLSTVTTAPVPVQTITPIAAPTPAPAVALHRGPVSSVRENVWAVEATVAMSVGA